MFECALTSLACAPTLVSAVSSPHRRLHLLIQSCTEMKLQIDSKDFAQDFLRPDGQVFPPKLVFETQATNLKKKDLS